VLNRLIEIDQMDIIDILNDDGVVKPIGKWPKVWRQFLSGMDVTELKGKESEAGFLKKIKWPDKLRNLELIGKHLGVWSDKVTHKHSFLGPDGEPPRFTIDTYYVSPTGKVTKTKTVEK
jgi:phage terminase small subunit